MVCAARGYPLVLVMADAFSVERRKLMRFLGAKVVLTPAAQRGSGMVNKAKELAKAHGWFLTRQFENEANADIHSRTTAEEIMQDFAGIGLDYWVTGTGTGGTLKGVSRVLKKRSAKTRIVVCEPDVAALMNSGEAQARNPDGSPAATHPRFSSHPVQGWTPDFIPKLAEDAREHIDTLLQIPGSDAMKYSRLLAREEGIFVGVSSGATLAGAVQVAQDAPQGSNILAMLPDTGERYLSTPLFEHVSADMNEEELAISKSTPGCQFG
jgi:cysteine synthase A